MISLITMVVKFCCLVILVVIQALVPYCTGSWGIFLEVPNTFSASTSSSQNH